MQVPLFVSLDCVEILIFFTGMMQKLYQDFQVVCIFIEFLTVLHIDKTVTVILWHDFSTEINLNVHDA